MTVTETNHVLNEMISYKVRSQMQNYMIYQFFESLIILAFFLAQAYYIRRLLTKGYSIV